MKFGVFVTGTDTGVGKTWIGQMIIQSLRKQGIAVTPKKPIESGWQNPIAHTDAGLLATAAGIREPERVCPNHYQAALSPPRAAALEGQHLLLNTVIQQCMSETEEATFLYVEGAGGFMSPLTSDGLNADLAKALDLPILLVAENRLGCINQVLLSLLAIEYYGLTAQAIVLNQINENSTPQMTQMNNAEDLQKLCTVPIVQVNYRQKTLPEKLIRLLMPDTPGDFPR